MKYFLPFLAILAGCSTLPIPADHSLKGTGIVVARDSGLLGGGCDHSISVDGKQIGKVARGTVLSYELPPGTYKVTEGTGMYADEPICPNIRMTLIVTIKDKPAILRIGGTTNGQRIFEQLE
jgi:hypothetical protein